MQIMRQRRQAEPQSAAVRMMESLPAFYHNQALELARTGSLAAARDRLLAALTLKPDMIDAHVVLGKVHAQMEDYRQAMACWEAVLTMDPENAAALAGIAKAAERLTQQATSRRYRQLAWVAAGVLPLLLGFWLFQTDRGGVASFARPISPPLDQMRAALQNTTILRGTSLEVVGQGQGIRILGRVDTEEQKQLAVAVAESRAHGYTVDMSGVTVTHPSPLAESLTRLLRQMGEEKLRAVVVEQEEGTLRLKGSVAAESDRQRVEALARSLVGVRAVDTSHLHVVEVTDYVLQPGETLWVLAARLYGEGWKWPRLSELNPHLPRDPQRIRPGLVLKVPTRRSGGALESTETQRGEGER